MVATVGEVRVKLSFDTKGAQTEMNSIQAQVEKGWSKTGAAIANIASSVVMKAIDKMTSSIGSAVDRVDTLNQFPKVLQNFGVSADEAAAATARIRDSVLGLPTSLDDAVAGVQKLFMVTNNLEESEKLFNAVNDAAIVFASGSSEAINNFIYGYSQSLAQGKVMAQEFNQMNDAIPGLMAKVAESMGMNVAQLKAGLSDGSISLDQFNEALKKLDSEGSDSMTALSESAFTASGGINTAVSLMQSAVDRSIAAIIESVGTENIQNAIVAIGDAFEWVGDRIADMVDFVKANSDWLMPVLVGLGTLATIITTITTAMKIWTAVQMAFNLVMNANPIFLLVTVIAAIIAALAYFFTQTEVGKQIFQGFGEAIGAVFDWIGSAFQAIGEVANAVFQAIAGYVQFAIDFWVSAFQGAWNFITGIFSAVGSFFQGVWNTIASIFTGIGTTIGDTVSGAFKNVVNGILGFIEGFVNTPINILNGFIDVINGAFGGIGVNLDHISTISLPRMAEGGLVTSATTAIVGEAGREAVIPLERNQGNWAGLLASTLVDAMDDQGETLGGREIVVNNYINSEMDADDIGRRLMTSLRRSAL